jgi:hypothetical protein
MKNTNHIMKKPVLFAIAALALLASCAKTEVVPVQNDGDQLISFQTAVSRQGTRALIDNAVYPIDETFGTFAYFNAKDTYFPTDAELYIPESEVKYKTTTSGSTTTKYWATETPYYWPKQGSLTFFSYSPYAALSDVTDCSAPDGITIDAWDVDKNQTVDILVADARTGETKNTAGTVYNGVPTVFRHKLAQIVNVSFKTEYDYCGGRTEATASVGDKFFYVNTVKINNVQYKGSYRSGIDVDGTNLGAWTVDADTQSYTWYDVQPTAANPTAGTAFGLTAVPVDPTAKLTNSYLLVMPQEFARPADLANLTSEKTIQISYTIRTCTEVTAGGRVFSTENVKDVVIPLWQIQGGKDAVAATQNTAATPAVEATAWNMNKKLSYTFIIGLDQILWDPSVVEWETQGTFEQTLK